MRTAFIEKLCEIASHDERIWLLTGDLGYSVLERFERRFPNRYVNTGIAEQNMMGVAAGIASAGNTVFVYSIANFPTLRCLEQIRNDVAYHALDVKIVSVGAGFAYGTAGYTHHGIEDMAALRSIPDMTIVSPADPVEAELATTAITKRRGPAYLRLGKSREEVLHKQMPDFEIGRAIQLRAGNDVTLIGCGSIMKRVITAADALLKDGIQARILSMPTIKPIDAESVRRAASETKAIITVEEHRTIGGLGSAVAEVLAEATGSLAPLRRIGAPDEMIHAVGNQRYHLDRFDDIASVATTMVQHSKSKGIGMPIAMDSITLGHDTAT